MREATREYCEGVHNSEKRQYKGKSQHTADQEIMNLGEESTAKDAQVELQVEFWLFLQSVNMWCK